MRKPKLRKIPDGTPITITGSEPLGAGSQGEVWKAADDGKPVAVKVYHRHTATPEQRAALERLIGKGSPAPCFLWPTAIVEEFESKRYGYIMDIREPNFRALEDFLARRVQPSMRVLLTTGMKLANGFLRLHSSGLCYRDISFANVFFDPKTGEVCICDNDNVDVSGAETGGVLGTPRFMAPEVVRGEAAPSAETDLYSLAVLLFFLLYGGHPLDGRREANIRCLDVPALERLYGFNPIYIWDPNDHSNRPVPDTHKNLIAFEKMYPGTLADLFQRSFTEGLHYPSKRVRESEWRKALSGAIDSIWVCGCGAESFYDPVAVSSGSKHCWSCRKPLALPPRIKIEDAVILLNRATRLFGYHVGSTRDDDTPIAEVVQNPRRSDLFGLRNLGVEKWTLTKPDGAVADVPPGRAAPILDGNRIHFGQRTGEVQA